MKYKNTKTGVIIDSPCKVSGGDWVEFIPGEVTEETKETEATEATEATEEYVEEEVNLEDMTNKELEELAEKEGIELTTADKKNKETRIAAIVKAFEE